MSPPSLYCSRMLKKTDSLSVLNNVAADPNDFPECGRHVKEFGAHLQNIVCRSRYEESVVHTWGAIFVRN